MGHSSGVCACSGPWSPPAHTPRAASTTTSSLLRKARSRAPCDLTRRGRRCRCLGCWRGGPGGGGRGGGVGAGAVGLAVAAELARTYSVVVLERHESYGRETTAHNSGVIHAGIYYPTGSWKHRLCLAGNPALYSWCEAHNVPARRTGKLIVALDGDPAEALDRVAAQARANEVPGVRPLTPAEAVKLEPAVPAVAALFSESSGIIDALAYTRSLET